MSETKTTNASDRDKNRTQPDRNQAAAERPVPSQAEGDRETVEEDLKEKS
jgi:hypothetical protein